MSESVFRLLLETGVPRYKISSLWLFFLLLALYISVYYVSWYLSFFRPFSLSVRYPISLFRGNSFPVNLFLFFHSLTRYVYYPFSCRPTSMPVSFPVVHPRPEHMSSLFSPVTQFWVTHLLPFFISVFLFPSLRHLRNVSNESQSVLWESQNSSLPYPRLVISCNDSTTQRLSTVVSSRLRFSGHFSDDVIRMSVYYPGFRLPIPNLW